jgi:REP element-mobilizing transposase RayT
VTTPRQILPGTTYLVTRRCAQREFLLRPSSRTNALFRYALAVAARRFGVRVHAFCVLSNHIHIVLTDPGARLPAFGQFLHALVARAMNASLGRRESFWAPSSYSAVALTSVEDVVRKTVYVLSNAVAAGLVARAHEWPGACSPPGSLGTSTDVERPDGFFRANGTMPASDSLELTVPPGFDLVHFRDLVAAGVAEAEQRAAVHAAEDRPRRTPERAIARPCSRPHASTRAAPKLNPRIAAANEQSRMDAVSRLREFVHRYRDAWRRWRRGNRDVVFPAGTYLLRVVHGACCAPA